MLGAALATAVFAQVTNLLVNRRLAVALGRQRLTGMRGHVVVIGLGSIGVRVAEGLLARGREVVVVERHDENRFLNQVRGDRGALVRVRTRPLDIGAGRALFVGAALGLHVLDAFYVDQQPFLLGRLSAGGGLAGTSMQELSARTRVVAIRRAATPSRLEHPPRRGTRFEPGDEAFLIGPYEELLRVLAQDRGLAMPGETNRAVESGAVRLPNDPMESVDIG